MAIAAFSNRSCATEHRVAKQSHCMVSQCMRTQLHIAAIARLTNTQRLTMRCYASPAEPLAGCSPRSCWPA
eukprot:10700630-Lingulodinium_polyedra.AAC.1